MNQDSAIMHAEKKSSTPPRHRKPIRIGKDSEGQISLKSSPEEVAYSLLGEGGDPLAAKPILEKVGSLGGSSETAINETLALVVGLEPTSTAEAILASQIVATHTISMRLHLAAAGAVDTRRLIDLTRCALTASRTTGELLGRLADGRRPAASTQKIIVERVDAGQVAIGCTGPEKGEGGA